MADPNGRGRVELDDRALEWERHGYAVRFRAVGLGKNEGIQTRWHSAIHRRFAEMTLDELHEMVTEIATAVRNGT